MKAVICGAGIAGLAAAKFLKEKGWSILIVEKARGLRTAGYLIDFMGTGYDAAEQGDLLAALKRREQPVSEVLYVNEQGRKRSRIDYGLARTAAHGRLMSLTRGAVEEALHETLPPGVEIRFGTTVNGFVNGAEKVSVELSDGENVEADLLIGADGIHSTIREKLFGPEEEFIRLLGLHTAAFIVEDAELSKRVDGRFQFLTVPGRQVAVFPVGEDKVTCFFAHMAESPSRPENVQVALRDSYGDLDWLVPKILECADRTDDIYYDVVVQVELPQWHKDRVLLIGDACYAVSLLAGQGASMAVAGAYALAEAIADAEDIHDALVVFENKLKPEIAKKQAAGRRTANWFVPPTEFHNVVRDMFLNMTRIPGFAWLLGRFFSVSLKGAQPK